MTIKELAETVSAVLGYRCGVVFDATSPDGPSRKFMNCDLLKGMGWQAQVNFQDGFAAS